MRCGPNFSIAYTELGIMYAWGMVRQDDFDSIEWYPNFFNVSIPKENLTEEFLWEFHLTDIQATSRQIFACDSKGRLYQCENDYAQALKPCLPQY
jgi:alpha-tubulin suppressor-like RCC1 family protein